MYCLQRMRSGLLRESRVHVGGRADERLREAERALELLADAEGDRMEP